jgi:nitroreductase
MLGVPTAIIVICTDPALATEAAVQLDKDTTPWIDVGTAAMNMMLVAHALELGACPATSFSKSAVSAVLKLPPNVVPEFILQLGHPASPSPITRQGPPTRATIDDLVFWESYGTTRRIG